MIDIAPLLNDVCDEHPRRLLFATVSGAHLYGFPSPDSDFDLRGVHLATPEEFLGLREFEETLDRTFMRQGKEIDLVTHDARKFFRLMLKRNGYVLEKLLSPLTVRTGPLHEELIALGKGCITRHHVHHYLGFAHNQWKLFRKEQPPRVKPLLYTYRVLLTGIHLMRTGVLNANIVELNSEFGLDFLPDLIDAKIGGVEKQRLPEADMDFYQQAFERLVSQLSDAGETSSLPDVPAAQAGLNDLLIRLRRAEV